MNRYIIENRNLRIITFLERRMCIGGVGKLFYEDGFPIGMAITQLQKEGVEVSLYHVADEMIKFGGFPFTKKGECTAFRKLSEELSIDSNVEGEVTLSVPMEKLKKFCHADYMVQREMIQEYMFGDRPVSDGETIFLLAETHVNQNRK